MKVRYSYLSDQFADLDSYLSSIKEFVKTEDFTLGAPLVEFEKRFAKLCDLPYAIGVGSGTDALILSLKILGVGPGDEVITAPNTFIATVGAIVMTGAKPVFVDNNEEYTIDVNKIEQAITSKTKAILPVHLTGCPADMPKIMKIAKKHNLLVVEDAAQAILASIDGKHVGSWGETACFSLHPLKNLNVWGDGGIIVTRSASLNRKLRLFRNHGLSNRDEVEFYGHNSRFDTIQAVIANRLIQEVHEITDKRIANAARFDEAFKALNKFITIPPRRPNVKQVYHTYVIQVENRDKLYQYLLNKGIRAKVHYPIPMHLQKASKYLKYKKGDFPVCEKDCRTILTLPVHQYLGQDQIDYIVECVHKFYKTKEIMSPKVIGIDFDNTIVSYDELMVKAARELGFLKKGSLTNKKDIRNAVRQLPDGEEKWQVLQAYVYGQLMPQAKLIEGVQEFFRVCQQKKIPVFIISHKTQYATKDTQGIDLRATAINWMSKHEFFDMEGLGLTQDCVFFESTREKKIARIASLQCTHFIDDLEETFQEKSFPKKIKKILYSPDSHSSKEDLLIKKSWREIREFIFAG